MMLVYDYEEVKKFFGDACFKMSSVRGGVVLPIVEKMRIPTKGENFRVGPFILQCRDVTGLYVIGSFSCNDF